MNRTKYRMRYSELTGTKDNWAPYVVRQFVDDQGTHFNVYQQEHKIASARLSADGSHIIDLGVLPEHRRRGITTALYKHIEATLGHRLKPSPTYQTPAGEAFWKSRD